MKKGFRPPTVKPVTKIKRASYGGKGKNSSEWRKLSDTVKCRDGYRCQKCKRHKSELRPNEYLETHHIKRVADGGTDKKSNMITLCSRCHEKMPGHSHLRR